MAIIRDNVVTEGFSGMLGKTIVFKQVRGKTIVCKRPVKPRTQSAQQKENRSRFRQASYWAKATLLDPAKKEYYQKKARKLKLPNAYTAAIADYMRTPAVMQVNQYNDKATFTVYKKDFDLKKVDIVVKKNSGETETRTLGQGECFFRLNHAELDAGVVVLATDATGVMREYPVLAA